MYWLPSNGNMQRDKRAIATSRKSCDARLLPIHNPRKIPWFKVHGHSHPRATRCVRPSIAVFMHEENITLEI